MRFKYLVTMRHFMIALNFIIVSFIGAQFLLVTQYILNHQLSSELLTTLAQVPDSPLTLFSECIISYGLLVLVMYIHYHYNFSTQNTLLLLVLEFILAFVIFFAVRMNYNGIFLLIFIDLLLTYRNLPTIQSYWFWGISGTIFLLLFSFSNYSLLGVFFKMPSLNTYLDFLPTQSRSLLVFFNNFLVSLNLITFISICLGYVIYILNRTHTVQSKLHSMQKANDELKSYAAISEKIAQDHERKRIARDIHDTVGHTLTGVAAGIDAIMVLIDINPEAAKTQLQKISTAVKQGIKEVRQVLNQMRPDALKSYTLESALSKMLKEYSDISHIKIELNYGWGNANFQKTTENIIFRVIEETVTNSLRHGHATKIWIKCTSNNSSYILSMHNNGKSETHIKLGYGITQMRERLTIINGTVEFDGKKGFTADDQQLIRDSIKIILESNDDFSVTDTFANGKEALNSIEKNKPDVILMDVRMPVMDGTVCTKYVKEKYPDIKVIILTTFDDDDFIFSALKYGASGYLLKGGSPADLFTAIRTVAQGGAMINPDITEKVFRLFSKMAQANYTISVNDQETKDFSKSEWCVIQQVGLGLSNKEISTKLFLSEGTVRNYISKILEKLNLRDRTQLAIWAVQTGVTSENIDKK